MKILVIGGAGYIALYEANYDFIVYGNLSNSSNNSPVNLMKFIETIENALDKKATKNFLPMQDGDVESTYADVSGLIDDFGYKPDTSLTDGIGEFIKWYRVLYKQIKQ